nr:putative integron gene cassette protein [uncultured bacterium]
MERIVRRLLARRVNCHNEPPEKIAPVPAKSSNFQRMGPQAASVEEPPAPTEHSFREDQRNQSAFLKPIVQRAQLLRHLRARLVNPQ